MIDLEEYAEEVYEYGADFVLEYIQWYNEPPPVGKLEIAYLGESSDIDERIEMLGQHESCLVEWQAVQDRVIDYMTIDYKALGESVLGEWNLMIEWAWK